MPIDSAGKRRSVFGWGLHPIGPIADGTIDAADRVHVSGRYSGISIIALQIPARVSYKARLLVATGYKARLV